MTTPSLLAALLALSTAFTAFGQGLEWVVPIAGTDRAEGYSITADEQGNVYSIGSFEGTQDFDPGPGEWSFTALGNNDIYATKMDPEGNLLWAYQCGSPSTATEWGRGIAVAADGSVYITGAFNGLCDFDPGPGVVEVGGGSGGTGFLVKLNADGSLAWVKRLGVGDVCRGHWVDVDDEGNVYCTGFANDEADFYFGTDVVTLEGNGNWAYVYKLDPTGTTGWVRKIGGDSGLGLEVDPTGNVNIIGFLDGTSDADPGPDVLNLTSNGDQDVIITKLTNTGDLIWARSFGGPGEEWGLGINADAEGNVFATGHYSDTVDFDPGPGVHELTATTVVDMFVMKLNSDGSFAWAHGYGVPTTSPGASYDNGYDVACDAAGNVYACGTFTGTIDFDPGPGVQELSAFHQGDIYLLKYAGSGELLSATSFGNTGYDAARSVHVNAAGDVIHLTGAFSNAVDFDPGDGEHILTATTSGDAFVLKLGPGSGTGIPEQAYSPIAIWPNPGTGVLNVTLGAGVHLIRLFDASGREVLAVRTEGPQAVIDGGSLTSGPYTLCVDGRHATRWLKL